MSNYGLKRLIYVFRTWYITCFLANLFPLVWMCICKFCRYKIGTVVHVFGGFNIYTFMQILTCELVISPCTSFMLLLQAELPYLKALVFNIFFLAPFRWYVNSYTCSVSHCEELHFSSFERQSSSDSRQVCFLFPFCCWQL